MADIPTIKEKLGDCDERIRQTSVTQLLEKSYNMEDAFDDVHVVHPKMVAQQIHTASGRGTATRKDEKCIFFLQIGGLG